VDSLKKKSEDKQANKGKVSVKNIVTKPASDSQVRVEDRLSWIHMGRLSEASVAENVDDYLKNNNITGKIECKELLQKTPTKHTS
jgi:hypothetical protein